MPLFKKVACFTDIHFGLKSNSITHLRDCEEFVDWFIAEGGIELYEDFDEKQYKKVLDEVKPLEALVKKYAPDTNKEDSYFMKEFILWALVENKKLNKEIINYENALNIWSKKVI